jgi:hypothetical protein
MDLENQTVEAVPNRTSEITVNVVKFLNGTPPGLSFGNFNIVTDPSGVVDVALDVTVNHPIPVTPQYDGYDVRAVFLGEGTGVMAYDGDLTYAE